MSNERNNLNVYTNLRVVPEEAQRRISGGRLNGFTDINSMWRIKRLTELNIIHNRTWVERDDFCSYFEPKDGESYG